MAHGALGGGTFTVQNKKLPGTYFRAISGDTNTVVWKDRGYATIALPLDWGLEGGLITVTNDRLINSCEELFGHSFTDPEMKPIRDILKGSRVLHLYNLNEGGTEATATAGELTIAAKYPGVSGNRISVSVEADINNENHFLVTTYFDSLEMDRQSVKTAEDFEPNDFVSLSGSLEGGSTVRAYLANGKNGQVEAGSHAKYLEVIQGEFFNGIAYAGTEEEVKKLYIAFINKLVYEMGYMCQLTLHHTDANERFINNVAYSAIGTDNAADSVYWYFGHACGIDLGKAIEAIPYDGEYEIEVITDVYDASRAIEAGQLKMIRTDGQIKLLEDINSFTNYSKELTEDWSSNEIMRIVMQRIQNNTMLFNQYYMKKELNDDIGRNALWKDMVWSASEQFQKELRLIENYEPSHTVVTKGQQKGGVVVTEVIEPVVTMSKLYLTTEIV